MGLQACNQHFGMRENAFSITPDLRYVYLSDRHKEALAHFLYGVEEGGGFIQLTGEVGTGKTTICRLFMEQLPDQVDVALLLQPPENGRELLQAILVELGLEAGGGSVREQVQRLFGHLLRAHGAGRRTVVILDEAQNIRPNVLEQLRMLTNLETPTRKLLQVFLVGQPELRDMLARPELRQVAQRITARYHLLPLDREETAGYVHHRLSLAGAMPDLFTRGALRQLHRESEGIPRVINILCDRALLGAFAGERQKVDAPLMQQAAREWRGETEPGSRARIGRAAWALLAGGLLTVALWAGGTAVLHLIRPASPTASDGRGPPVSSAAPSPLAGADGSAAAEATQGEPPSGKDAPSSAAPVAAHTVVSFDPANYLGSPKESAVAAGTALLKRWNVDSASADPRPLCTRAGHVGLECLEGEGGMKNLEPLDRPAVVSLRGGDGKMRQAALLGMEDGWVLVGADGKLWTVPRAEFERRWDGRFTILWRPPFQGGTLLGIGVFGPKVQWLRRALDHVDGLVPKTGSGRYDAALRARVQRFQISEGLPADGVAGPQTLIRLNTRLGTPPMPQLHSTVREF